MPRSPDNVLGSCDPQKVPPASRGEIINTDDACAAELLHPDGAIAGFRTLDNKLVLTLTSSKGQVLSCNPVKVELNSPTILDCGEKKFSVSLAADGATYIRPFLSSTEQNLGNNPMNSKISPSQTAVVTPESGEAEQSIYVDQIRASLSQALTPSPEFQKFIDAAPAIVWAPLGSLLFWALIAWLQRAKKK